MSRGANIEHRDIFDKSPLYFAAAWGRHDVLETLLNQDANTEHQDLWGYTALMRASCMKHADNFARVMKLLSESGASMEQVDKNGITALGHASIWRREDVVKFLCDQGANDQHRDKDGNTPLDYRKGFKIVGDYQIAVQRQSKIYVKELTQNIYSELHINDIDNFFEVMRDLAEETGNAGRSRHRSRSL